MQDAKFENLHHKSSIYSILIYSQAEIYYIIILTYIFCSTESKYLHRHNVMLLMQSIYYIVMEVCINYEAKKTFGTDFWCTC